MNLDQQFLPLPSFGLHLHLNQLSSRLGWGPVIQKTSLEDNFSSARLETDVPKIDFYWVSKELNTFKLKIFLSTPREYLPVSLRDLLAGHPSMSSFCFYAGSLEYDVYAGPLDVKIPVSNIDEFIEDAKPLLGIDVYLDESRRRDLIDSFPECKHSAMVNIPPRFRVRYEINEHRIVTIPPLLKKVTDNPGSAPDRPSGPAL